VGFVYYGIIVGLIVSKKEEGGYFCRDCGIYTHKSNSKYVRGWMLLGYCSECVVRGKPSYLVKNRKDAENVHQLILLLSGHGSSINDCGFVL